jgi:membrane associated rhomboid family serine protease
MDRGRWQRLWRRVLSGAKGTGVRCPGCGGTTAEVRDGALAIDSCRRCQLIWFDKGEIPSVTRAVTPVVAEARARIAVAREREEAETPWQIVCGWLGLPYEIDGPHLRRAYVTGALAGLLVLVHILATSAGLERTVAEWGFVPARMWRHEGATWITSFFLHGGWLHLLSNVYFLVVFGDNAEEDLGSARYVVLVVLGAVLGCLLHAAIDPRADLPVVGASAGISAVLFYYAFRFPKARIGWAWRIWLVPVWWFRMTAKTAFALWILLQLLLAYLQVRGLTHVSALGHLGGVLAGVLFVVSQRAAAAEDRHGARL